MDGRIHQMDPKPESLGDGIRTEVGWKSISIASLRAFQVEMESCSESMAPGAWSGISVNAAVNKFRNDGHAKDGLTIMNELRKAF